MRILINLSRDEINVLGQMTEITDEDDIVFCLHELIERMSKNE